MNGFTWRDAGRVVVFGKGGLAGAGGVLREHGFGAFELLSTPRALGADAGLAEAAASVHEVHAGGVPEAAAALLERVKAPCLVALGGGRVIDTAKAIAAVSGASVAALPTTMSGAEMTGFHRLPAGAEDRATRLVRPVLVLADPALMTSQTERALRFSSMNALAHGADSLYTPFANPVSEMTALRGAELIATTLDQGSGERDREALALGSILCGYAIDSAAFGMHHVICQTLVRVCGSPHAETNAAILPLAMAAMVPRAPAQIAALADALGSAPAQLERRLRDLGGDPPGLGAIGADRGKLEQALESILIRPELAFTPDPPGREELKRLLQSAW